MLILEDGEAEAARLLLWLSEDRLGGFDVHHVGTLAEALEALGTGHFDVALLDLHVPDSKGIETFHRVHTAAPEVPIVVQSGMELASVALEAVASGAQDYLLKRTLEPELVRRALRYAVERSALRDELRESQERYERALEGAQDGIWDWHVDEQTLHVSPRWCELLGIHDGRSISTPQDWWMRVHPDDIDPLLVSVREHIAGNTEALVQEHRVRDEAGSWRWMLARGKADRRNGVLRLAGSLSDITARRRASERLLHEALHDQLTGLPNRTLLLDRLEQAIRRGQRRDGPRFAVLFLDLDRFKVINDSLGHLVGDQLLVSVAHRLRVCVRPDDTVARLGGDEFAVLLEGVEQDDATHIAGRIASALATPLRVQGREVFTSASIGICLGKTEYTRPEDLLRDADTAMYKAKRLGKNRFEVFDDQLHRWAMARLELETGLRRAVDREEFRVHYQPIVTLATGQLVGFEALVRWQRPGQGLLSPQTFIEEAEETGIINAIGASVLGEATRFFAQLPQVGPPLTLSVNVSSRQLRQPDFVQQVATALKQSGLSGDRLALELTETALIENADSAAEMLEELRRTGVHIHLDDFGAGYSSLSYLHRFPIDKLKIDRSFVAGLSQRPENDAIIQAIIDLARALGKEVVAEGIETRDQLHALRGLECRYGQGYLFGRPTDPRTAWDLAGLGASLIGPTPVA